MALDRGIDVNKALLVIAVVNAIRKKLNIVDDKFCFYTTGRVLGNVLQNLEQKFRKISKQVN